MIDTVVKLGGAVLRNRAWAAVAAVACDGRTLIVPGGGPFADTVREVDARLGSGDDAAHWAAILAMDQYAHVLAGLIPGAPLVTSPAPGILAPYQWLRAADPLPHSWEVTSDSIAAWIAGAVGTARLLLVKPVDRGSNLVDPYFRCVRGSLDVRVLGVDVIETLASVLASPAVWRNLSSL